MQFEKNFFDNIFYTVMDVKGKTKDNVKVMMDLKEYCRQYELKLQIVSNGKVLKSKANYTLSREQEKTVCEWVQDLKMPNGYASNLARCVNMN